YLVKRKGDDKKYCVSTSILTDEEGQKDGIVHTIKSMEMVGRLIDEQRKTQEQLRRGRMKMQAIFDSIADGVFSVDREGTITHFSRSMEKITGFSEEEVLGKQCAEVLRGNICETDCPIVWSVKEKKGIEKCREVIVTKDCRTVPVYLTTSLPLDGGEFTGVVCTVHDRSEIEGLRRELQRTTVFPEMIGKSKKMTDLFALIKTVSGSDVPVLIEGETGTGKELVARVIHQRSSRNRGPFVAVNCSALSPFLLESELFGHAKGAFTGAIKDKKGKLEVADGGTLFLDEVSEINPDVQVKLLRFLQFREFERVGETETRKVDMRVIAATNRDLKKMAREGKFRKDLYYRLNGITVGVPPLRQRKEDIPLLVEHFINKHKKTNPDVEGVSSRGIKNLIEHSWPGNARELENAVMYAMASCPGRRIERMCLPPDVRNIPADECPQAGEMNITGDDLEHIEKQRVVEALMEYNWKVIKAAESIGYSRITMWRRMKKFGIRLPNRK
ncbi:MAG: sigma 54-interacting transcriptional regulator, partial [Deltaproteobacteria bacterium]|nr:sigma 54-interacting transcriptional regulator [Deltaproteobacteria bacterium]